MQRTESTVFRRNTPQKVFFRIEFSMEFFETEVTEEYKFPYERSKRKEHFMETLDRQKADARNANR